MTGVGTSSGAGVEAPPLFLTVATHKRATRSFIVTDRSPPSLEAGEHFCAVHAPNGKRGEGELAFSVGEDPASCYGRLLSLVTRPGEGRTDPAEFLAEPGAAVPLPVTTVEVASSLAFWRGGQCLEADEVGPGPAGGAERSGMVRLTVDEGVDNVQTWSDSGPSIIVRCSPESTLYRSVVIGRSGPVSMLHMVGPSALASAYWGFLRHSFVDAAGQLGRTIALGLSDGGHGDPELVAAAHWAARFGGDGLGKETAARLEGSGRSDPDATILRWVLACRFSTHGEGGLADLFRAAMGALGKEAPLYTETLRLVLSKLSFGLRSYTREKPNSELAEQVDRTHLLARCTYWDSERISYRGAKPGSPDPDATGADVPDAAKKK